MRDPSGKDTRRTARTPVPYVYQRQSRLSRINSEGSSFFFGEPPVKGAEAAWKWAFPTSMRTPRKSSSVRRQQHVHLRNHAGFRFHAGALQRREPARRGSVPGAGTAAPRHTKAGRGRSDATHGVAWRRGQRVRDGVQGERAVRKRRWEAGSRQRSGAHEPARLLIHELFLVLRAVVVPDQVKEAVSEQEAHLFFQRSAPTARLSVGGVQ